MFLDGAPGVSDTVVSKKKQRKRIAKKIKGLIDYRTTKFKNDANRPSCFSSCKIKNKLSIWVAIETKKIAIYEKWKFFNDGSLFNKK